jgi:hypothetical protein
VEYLRPAYNEQIIRRNPIITASSSVTNRKQEYDGETAAVRSDEYPVDNIPFMHSKPGVGVRVYRPQVANGNRQVINGHGDSRINGEFRNNTCDVSQTNRVSQSRNYSRFNSGAYSTITRNDNVITSVTGKNSF